MNPEISSTDRFVDRLSRNVTLDPLADLVQPAVRSALDGTGPLAPLKDVLHGTPLNHPLHPALTDIPIGAWSLAAIFDAAEIVGRAEFRPAADLAIGVGLGGALLAVATGLAEWSDTIGEPKRLGTWHALLNTLGASAYIASLTLRAQRKRGAAIATAFGGYGIVAFAAYLGGELAFGLHIGAKHAAPPIFPPSDFKSVLADAELPPDSHRRIDFSGIPILISRDAGGVLHAVSAVCTHRGGPLEEGEFADGYVRCPWHGGRFKLADGAVVEGPPVFPLAHLETRVRTGHIEVRPIAAPA
ncbi:MAG: Rieske 2Fe-2S domain-containing protein [Candidatus Eremiobacteraeota bacterium]|nr:Rieske 2Fe-2S domain-containing protein [Candidatus Eremiobacteraeota bacterium]